MTNFNVGDVLTLGTDIEYVNGFRYAGRGCYYIRRSKSKPNHIYVGIEEEKGRIYRHRIPENWVAEVTPCTKG